MRIALIAAAVALTTTSAVAAPEAYTLDPSHSQVAFSYEHFGFSTTRNLLSGWEGQIMFDAEDPAASSVEVSIPVRALYTGWDERFEHMMSPDLFDASDDDLITFKSTSIEVTDSDEAIITGDLTINGITQSVQLETEMNQHAAHPVSGTDWLGFDAETKIKRSDFDLGQFAPSISDELDVKISIEAGKAE